MSSNPAGNKGDDMSNKLRVLFICKARGGYTQGRFGLWNSASFVVHALNQARGFDAKLVDAVDGNSVDKLVTQNKPDVVILEAVWVTPDKLRELTKLHPRVQWVCRGHSKMTFLATEGVALEWLMEIASIPRCWIAGNNYEFTQNMSQIGYRCLYLPNIYMPPYRYPRCRRSDSFYHIGCFGSPRPMKNQLAQAVAAIIFANSRRLKLAFHINSATLDQGTINVVKNLRALFAKQKHHKLVDHEWQDHNQFCELVASMDIGMQVSLSESYNIVSADFVWNSVPIIVSKEITFVDPTRRVDNKTTDMVSKLQEIYDCREHGHQNKDLQLLNNSNHMALKAWLSVLSR